jgi:RNA polymerase sigma factor (sigma-70 family)
MATGLTRVLEHLQQAGGGLSDRQLLAHFNGARDEAAFAALVRRHGPMVLGVCRRVLGDFHDAEDAFQATFLVLARKAASLVVGDSLGCWLYGVAYRTAAQARALGARRRSRERPMNDVPHPQVPPAEPLDWLPLLDRELSLLPEKYRAAIVLCDLEGRTRRDAARLLKVPEGTLSSRLAAGRQLLARRLARCGVAVSGGALAVTLSQGTTSAALPAALVRFTSKAAALVAAGQTAGSAPVVLLMKGVMKAMLLKKLRMAIGAVMVVAALGAVGFGYQAGGSSGAAQAAPPDRPQNELEALRRENELLKLNLEVVLEKVRTQASEIQGLRKEVALNEFKAGVTVLDYDGDGRIDLLMTNHRLFRNEGGITLEDVTRKAGVQADDVSGPAREAEAALKALREAKDREGQRRATQALEKALEKLKQQTRAAPGKGKP